MKITVKIDINEDAKNWWNGCNRISFGNSWKEQISKSIQNKIVNKTKEQAYSFLIPYLKKQYKRNNIEKVQKQSQEMFDLYTPEIFSGMERVTNKKIYRKSFICFLTTFPRAPYDPKYGYVWLPIQWSKRHVNIFLHELLHFQTLYYFEKQILKKLDEREKENLKETLTVILNAEFKNLSVRDNGYRIHEYLREDLFWFWKKHRNFKQLISYGISVYPKYADTIKYLGFGAYSGSCPDFLLDKIKRLRGLRTSKAFIYKVLRVIKEEFNPKKHKTMTTNFYQKSRFISVKDILHKRQIFCGSMATVVASVFRSLGQPVKLIDGFIEKDGAQRRHAWNEIYIPTAKKFVSFDIT